MLPKYSLSQNICPLVVWLFRYENIFFIKCVYYIIDIIHPLNRYYYLILFNVAPFFTVIATRRKSRPFYNYSSE